MASLAPTALLGGKTRSRRNLIGSTDTHQSCRARVAMGAIYRGNKVVLCRVKLGKTEYLGEIEEKRKKEKKGRLVCSAGGIGRGVVGIEGREGSGVEIPERMKVVGLMALVMCLCNADRVVMSVAIVPLAAKYGWSSSFLGIVQVFGVNLKQAAWFSAIPWGMMAISGYIAGAASDLLIKSGYSVTLVRKIMQPIGFIGPGVSLLCLNFAKTPSAAAAFLTAALSLSSFSQAGFLLNMQDIAPQYAGFLHGVTNSIGTVAAIISTIGTGYFVQWLGSFQAFLTITAFLYFITTIFWNLYATGERVFY